MAKLSGLALLLSVGAIVTTLSPRLPRGCQLDNTFDVVPANDGTTSRRWPLGELISIVAVLLDEYCMGSHGRTFSGKACKIHPRHRRPAAAAGLRAGAVCLSAQSFPQPRARQHLDGGACRGSALSYPVLAISPGRDHILHCGPAACGPRDPGALPATGISLEGDRAAATRARLEYP